MTEPKKQIDLQDALKPLFKSAAEAEDRLSKLEAVAAAISMKKGTGKEELSKNLSELQAKLEHMKAEQVSEREKAQKEIQKLAAENAKMQYRIIHLVRALKEADSKLEAK
ncbi:uncharacterized protein LOC131168396 [Malania oleifera]|uniref:uncharacterized protein LOC131168396 n=1 Tax=Malania oleifera TaxID=397392 RepID=UPI0025ADC590|nr:uncharacterized protein LOC131168396 [Malania oleifera]XP_057983757.1 uncharacterized protein LOC131168396 [Malania oleifera]